MGEWVGEWVGGWVGGGGGIGGLFDFGLLVICLEWRRTCYRVAVYVAVGRASSLSLCGELPEGGMGFI